MVLAEHFTRGGYQVVEAGDPDAAVKKAGKLGKGGVEFLLVTDLGMPTSDEKYDDGPLTPGPGATGAP